MNKNGRRTVYKRIMELCGERLWTIDAKYVRIARCLCEARQINLPEGVVWLPVEAYTPSQEPHVAETDLESRQQQSSWLDSSAGCHRHLLRQYAIRWLMQRRCQLKRQVP